MKKLLAVAALLLGGCMMSNVVSPSLVERVSGAELGCPEAQMKVEQLTDTSWKASGCGKEATYTCWTSVGMGEGTCTRGSAGPAGD